MKGIYNAKDKTVTEVLDTNKFERPKLSYEHPDHSRLWAEWENKMANYISSVTYPAIGFSGAKDGEEVEYKLKRQVATISSDVDIWRNATNVEYYTTDPMYRRVVAVPDNSASMDNKGSKTPMSENGDQNPESEMLKVAMSLVRCGWQMACDELISWCSDKKVTPAFMGQIIDMMDKEKKRQFDWQKLREELEKMDIGHLMPKTK